VFISPLGSMISILDFEMKADEDLLERLIEEAAMEEIIHCPICNSALEPDAKKCGDCGWENILVLEGYI